MKTFLGTLVLGVWMSLAARAERVALVIGNNAYANLPSQMQLQSPVSDATDVAAALEKLGYRIIGDKPLTNGTRDAMTGAPLHL